MNGLCKCGCGKKTSTWRYGPKIGQPRDYITGHNVAGTRRHPIVDGKKACTECEEWKALEHFYEISGHPGHYRGRCRECSRRKRNEATKAYYYRHPERTRKRNLGRRYNRKGITQERWEDLFASQLCVCAICGTHEPGTTGWHTDHDHSCCPGTRMCGKCIRGILCSLCNVGLGAFRDSTDLLASAAAYLDASA